MTEGLTLAVDVPSLPKNWTRTKVGDIYEVVSGGTPSRDVESYWTGDIPWISSADIYGPKDIRPRRSISEQAIQRSATHLVPEGSLIVVTRVGLGKVGIAPTRLCFSQDSQALIGDEKHICPLFSLYYLSQAVQVFKQQSRGTTIAGVPKKQLAELTFALPPVNEQHRIVAEIEKQFSRLDVGIAALKRAQANLRRYRASVLKAACEGRLVPQDPSDEPASELLKRLALLHQGGRASQPRTNNILAKETSNDLGREGEPLRELPAGWSWSRIGQVAECLDYRRVPINKKERALRIGSVPYYGANGPVGWIDDYIFDEPLVLVVEDETFTGREKPFSYKVAGKSWVNNHAHVLRATATIDTDFLNISLAYYPFTPLTTGSTGRRKLTQAALMSAPYALPPLAEQHRIVAEVDRRVSVVEELEAVVAANLKRAERLRQAILKRAFEGRLVPQDPDDEPASVLLEKIRAERNEAERGNKRKAMQLRLPTGETTT